MKPSLHIVYATTGGNTLLVCQWVAGVLSDAGFEVVITHHASITPENLSDYKHLILASPTYGHGQLEPTAIKWYAKAGSVDLTNTIGAIIGLGDAKYDSDYTVESAVILTEFAEKNDMKIVCEPLKIAGQPVPQLQTVVQKWAENLALSLQNA